MGAEPLPVALYAPSEVLSICSQLTLLSTSQAALELDGTSASEVVPVPAVAGTEADVGVKEKVGGPLVGAFTSSWMGISYVPE